jgi:hypothetical protein
MTLAANGVVMPGGFLAARNPMRIVTRQASQSAFTLQKALRLAQAHHRTYNLKLRLASGHGRYSDGGAIEKQQEVAQRLAGIIGEWSTVKSPDGSRKAQAGGLQVALHADLQLPVSAQPRGI